MITRKFKDINTNTFIADLAINARHPNGDSRLEFKILINSGRADIENVQKGSLHPEANRLNMTILPSGDNLSHVQPITIDYNGSWNDFIANIKFKLLELNKLDKLLNAKLAFTLIERDTKYEQIIKSVSDKVNFTQLISESDIEFASVEKVMKDITDLQNKEAMDSIKNYIYNIMVSE